MNSNVAAEMLLRGSGGAPAILHGDETVTYDELRADVDRTAAFLLAAGHRKGDRVGLWAENGRFFVTAYLGSLRAGLVAVPFQPDLGEDTFDRITRDAQIRVMFVGERPRARLTPWAKARGIELLGPRQWAESSAVPRPSEWPEIDPAHDLAALMFTSGSTGVPKGVMVTHRNIRCNTLDILSYLGLTASDRVMVVLPFHYCFGVSLLHTHLWAGGSVALNNQFMYPERVLADMQEKACTGLAGVPSTYQILLRKSRFAQLRFPALRWFQQAGGKLPNPFIQELLRAFPGVKFFLMYGQTEATARLSYLPPERLADKLGSIGKGLPSTRIEVLRSDGNPVCPGSDEVGEIVASGDNITAGYWRDPAETAKFFRGGKLYTGDLARVDAEGFVYVVEREREFIKSKGNRVSAKEVEDVIAEVPQVVEVAVIGVPDELWGEAIKACVVPTQAGALRSEDIAAHCRRRLPLFKCPEQVEFLRVMPKTSAGKIAKMKLREPTAQLNPKDKGAAAP